LVFSKYFKGIISYEGLQRIEDYPVPRTAFREAVLKAISKVIGITSRGVEKSISELKKRGIIDRVGPPKGGRWVVKQSVRVRWILLITT